MNIVNAKDGAWKIMASSKGGDDEQPQMFAIFCVHVYTRIHAWFQIKYVTRNKSYVKGKAAWSWPRHDSFILNPKLGWSLADGHKHSHQSTEVSTNVVMEDVPVVSTRPSHQLMQSGCPDSGCYVCHWLVRIKITFCAG